MTKIVNEEWWKSAVLYQIYPISFADSNGDGWGDIPGITERLDYVASLGVDGIWLSPFYLSAWSDYGYDTIDQTQVDPRCGTIADFDTMVEKAHKLGLKVLIDQVYTYTSNRHPWFLESRSNKHNPRRDWYCWAPPKMDGAVPNNWNSIFGGPAWFWDMKRRQYYMTHFLPDMPHLCVQHPDVQEELLSIGRFWLNRGVDGFRLDVINLTVVDDELRDNPTSGETDVLLPAHAQISKFDSSRPEALEFVKRIRLLADEKPGRFLLGEIAGRAPMEDAKCYTTGSDVLHSAYFLLGADKEQVTATSLLKDLSEWADDRFGWPTWSISNHDVMRAVTRCSGAMPHPDMAGLLSAVVIAARGTALLYQGDELGLPDAQLAYEDLRDPASRRFYPDHLQRDGARTPMAWDGRHPKLGFTSRTPWLPVAESHRSLAVAQQVGRPHGTLEIVKSLIKTRKDHPALGLGSISFEDFPDPILAFTRTYESEKIFCAFNVSSEPALVNWSKLAVATQIIGHGILYTNNETIELAPYGFIFAEAENA